MTRYLEEIEASYLQDPSFVGQRVVVPAVGASPAIFGVLSDVAVYQPGDVARLVAHPGSAGYTQQLRVASPHVELFLGGRVVALAPGDLVLVEPMPATPTP